MTTSVRLLDVSGLSDVAEYAYAATTTGRTRLVFLAGSCPTGSATMPCRARCSA